MDPKGYCGTYVRIVPWAAIWLSIFLAPICYFGLVVAQDIGTWKVAAIVIITAILFGMMVAIPTAYLAMARTVDIPCVDRGFVKWIVDWKANEERYDTLSVMKDGLIYDKSKNPTLMTAEIVVKFRDDVASITGPRIVINSLVRTFRAYHR
jgi:hypothetical protein